MTMHAPLILPPEETSPARRWILAAIIVILVHAGLVYWLSRRTEQPNPAGAPEAAILIELPPAAVAAPAPSVEAPPGPLMKEAEPEPQPPAELEQVEPRAMAIPELPPAEKPDAVLVAPEKPAPEKTAPKVEPKPKVEAKPHKKFEKETPKPETKRDPGPPAPRTSAPRQSAAAPGREGTQATRGAAGSSISASAWQGLVSAQVNRNTRYPPSAQGASGAAAVTFSLDRSGRLISANLSRSSGSAALDSEAVAIVRRASPFPPPPAELPGGRFNFSKTINFRQL